MNIIFKITKNELRNLFYSPVAWFLLIVFLVQCAMVYGNILYPIAHAQDIYKENNPNFRNWGELNSFTRIFFTEPGSLFSHTLRNLYLFVPLLTMGIISREVNNGTIKLLYSSPLTIRQIVLGKFLAVVVYNLVLMCIVCMFMVTAALVTNTLEYGMLLSSLLGFFLLICAYSAIGIFMSSLTTYQIVSAISTFTIILVLTHINGLWQKYDFVRDLTWFLCLVGRTDKLLLGLITTKDVIYFIVVICLFLSFTLIKLRAGRESKPWYLQASRYLAVTVIALAIGYVSSRPRFTVYWDTTSNDANTIHPRIQEIIKALGPDEPMEVVLYTNLLDGGAERAFPENRNVYLHFLWEQYVRFKPNIEFSYKYYYDYDEKIMGPDLTRRFPNKNTSQLAEKIADLYGLDIADFATPEEMKAIIDLKPERLKTVMQVRYKGRTEFLRTFPDTQFWPDQSNVSAVFKRLMEDTIPKIVYITGNMERSVYKSGEREYGNTTAEKRNRTALVNIGFDVDTVSLDDHDIPADAEMVVLADPKTGLSPALIGKVRNYVNNGGNMFILGEPKKQDILNPVLDMLGVKLLPGNIVQLTEHEMPHMVVPYLTETATWLSDNRFLYGLRKLREKRKADPTLNLFGEDTARLLMPGVTGIAYTADSTFTIQPLTATQENTWLKMGPLVVDSAAPVFSAADGDIKGSLPTSIQLTRKINGKEQRIVVCGDADFASNMRASQDFLFVSIYSWLNKNKFPIYTNKQPTYDNLLLIGGKMAASLKIAFIWVLPGIVLLLSTILLIRRKRK